MVNIYESFHSADSEELCDWKVVDEWQFIFSKTKNPLLKLTTLTIPYVKC